MKRSLGKDDPRHGTRSAYTYHGCRCDLCRAAQAAYMREWMSRQQAPPPNSWRHGMRSTYVNYGCRCDLCTAANAAACAAQREAASR